MRDPKRIDEFCDRLKEEWKKLPDWRFGQLLCNVFSDIAMDERVSVFYIEDDRLMKLLTRYVDSINQKAEESHISQ